MADLFSKKKFLISAIIFFIICFSFSTYLSFVTRETLMDADSSAELVLSKELAENNALVDTDWYYSTEIRLLNTQIIYSAVFKFTDDWGMVRFVSATVMKAMLVLSYFYFARKLKIKWEYVLLSSGLMLLPVSIVYARIVLIHNYYIPHSVISFIALGLFIEFLESSNKAKKHVLLFFQAVLAFAGSLGGIRYLQIIYVPLFLATLFVLINDRKLNSLKSPVNKKDLLSLKNVLFKTDNGTAFNTSIILCVFAGAGYLVNSRILSDIFSFYSYEGTTLTYVSENTFTGIINNFFESIGYFTRADLMSFVGIASIVMLCCYLYIIWRSVDIIKEKGSNDIHKNFLPIFFLSILSINVTIFFITEINTSHYFLPIWMYIFPLAVVEYSNKSNNRTFLKSAVSIGVFICLILNSAVSSKYLVQRPRYSNMFYSGLCYRNPNQKDDLQPVIDYLYKNDYKLGFARFLNSNVIIEMTQGEIECVPIEPNQEEMEIFEWGTFKKYTDLSYYKDKKLFMIMNKDGVDSYDSTYLTKEERANEFMKDVFKEYDFIPVYQDNNYVIYIYN